MPRLTTSTLFMMIASQLILFGSLFTYCCCLEHPSGRIELLRSGLETSASLTEDTALAAAHACSRCISTPVRSDFVARFARPILVPKFVVLLVCLLDFNQFFHKTLIYKVRGSIATHYDFISKLRTVVILV